MKKQRVERAELVLVGVTTRTNNVQEMNPDIAKIGMVAAAYWGNQLAKDIKHRVNPGVTYAIYTEFESDETGDYTYFIGEVVQSMEDQDLSKFESLMIPAGVYQKFTSEAGEMPEVVIASWQEIWKMQADDFGGTRAYQADFEVYDERASDPNHTVIDIYVGIHE